MNNNNENSGVMWVLLVIFIVLKATGEVDWSWLWVLGPIWIPIALVLILKLIEYFLRK